MQPFVNVHQKGVAIIFTNYLKTIGIETDIAPAKDDHQQIDGWTIFCSLRNIEQAKIEFEQFSRMPNHPRYQQSSWESGHSIKLTKNSAFRDEIKQNFFAQAGKFTIAIFAICWAVFLLTSLYFDSTFAALKFNQQGDISQTLSEPWRLLTPALVHFSLIHIAFNTMWWWQLGGQIEKVLGVRTIATLFIVSALLSNISQFYVSGFNFGGLSGVVYATVGFVWWYGYLRPGKGIYLSNSIVGFMLVWLLLGFTEFMPISVANTAHLVGLISGIALAIITVKTSTLKY